MSLATLDAPVVRTQPTRPFTPSLVPAPAADRPTHAASTAVAPQAQPETRTEAPRLTAVPARPEARGFVLYVGLDELKAAESGISLAEIVEQLKQLTQQLAPTSETHAAVALAPHGAGGRDVDVVRLALQDPSAIARHRDETPDDAPEPVGRGGIVVDISRKRVQLDGENAGLTYKEFELLQYLVLREGSTIDRAELIRALWSEADDDIPNERTIDVHVRRLRSKLGAYEDIVRTVRGVGYRFDRHADVAIRYASTPSPDVVF